MYSFFRTRINNIINYCVVKMRSFINYYFADGIAVLLNEQNVEFRIYGFTFELTLWAKNQGIEDDIIAQRSGWEVLRRFLPLALYSG